MIEALHAERPVIILDRDGVINHDSDHYIKHPDEWVAIEGSLEAISRLSHEGWRVFVATNQSGLARGLFDMQGLHAIHRKMQEALAEMGGTIEAIFFCPHGPDEGCLCRKPAPGLISDILSRADHPALGTPVVGDSHRDLSAAHALGARPILVQTGKGRRTLEAHASGKQPLPPGTQIVSHLAEAVDLLLSEPRQSGSAARAR